MSRLPAAGLGLCLLLCAVAVHAQEDPIERDSVPAAPAPVERQLPHAGTITVQSRLVPIALNVTDEHGTPVAGLTRDQFELSEDGVPQRLAIFEKESSTPLNIVLAIDTSESVLLDEHLERDAAKQFVKALIRPQDKIDLLSFSETVSEIVPFTNQPKAFESGLGRMAHGAATAMYDTIYLASDLLRDQPAAGGARRVIVLITDGDDTTHHGSYASSLEEAERAGAMIYALIIVPIEADAGRNTGGEHALIQLSEDTGGKFYYVADKRDLVPAFQRVSDDLRTQYTLGYYAPEHGGDARGLRHIELRLKDPALRARYTLRYRTAYYGR
jgi:Ca-activated chloride channel family protein